MSVMVEHFNDATRVQEAVNIFSTSLQELPDEKLHCHFCCKQQVLGKNSLLIILKLNYKTLYDLKWEFFPVNLTDQTYHLCCLSLCTSDTAAEGARRGE
jgi:hypothetical protein